MTNQITSIVIPSIPDLPKFTDGQRVHLLLEHLLEEKEYTKFYQTRSLQGDYIILDNSAHERGFGQQIEELLEGAKKVFADELVVPDVLFDGQMTVTRAFQTFQFLRESSDYHRLGCNLMVVPQGKDRAEWELCLATLLDCSEQFQRDVPDPGRQIVIGLSKDFETWKGGLLRILQESLYPQYQKGYQIHLLGWGRDLWALGEIGEKCPWVRSVDSAKPLVYGHYGIPLAPGGQPPPYPTRPENYFNITLDHPDVIQANIEVFRNLVQGF